MLSRAAISSPSSVKIRIRHGAVDDLLRVEDAGDKVVFLIDERGGQLGDIHAAAAQRQKLLALVGEISLHQLGQCC